MATLRDIRRRIRSVKNTQQITRAMKMVAAAKLRRAQRNLFALRPYAEAFDRIRLEAALRFIGHEHPLLEVRPERRTALLLMTSDRGLCGSFNHNLVRACTERLARAGGTHAEVSVVGARGAQMIRRLATPTEDVWTERQDPADFRESVLMAERFVRRFKEGRIDALDVLFAEFRSPIAQPIRVRRLLPIEPLQPEPASPRDAIEAYLFEPGDEALAEAILVRNVAVQVFRALSETQTSEHAARMTAMEGATDNADDMIATLTLQYNRARQQAITRELLDIVGGAGALESR